ncbi:alpha/beta hydrolase [Corynebacterium lowii]|uniref:Phospholipase YtpA n=1 Tax=Corynebacterium lowii TaxID=1544413 RepID=A0A0Q0UB65_9CORY|nr:alpha/beta hydrolase [Corynebacterium lowii]KQB83451.1 Phospholipase YtpA [Corynebacterium lowii]MDP9852496.1 alpha-beta hydrolase superfamily lysophospholipase [Corynebacterium lowii]
MTSQRKNVLRVVAAGSALSLALAGIVPASATVAPQAPAANPAVAAPQAAVEEGFFTSTDGKGTQVYWKSQTVPNAKGNVVVVHGAAEHSGRYDYVADRLLADGYNVYRLDHRGHGKTADAGNSVVRGHIDDFQFLVDDVHTLTQKAKAEHPDVKTFMLGHSMGALAAQFYGIKYPGEVAGIVTNGGGAPLNLSGRNEQGQVVTPQEITDMQRELDPTLSERLPLTELTTFNTMLAQQVIPGRTEVHVPSLPFSDQIQVPNAFTDGVASDPEVTAQYTTDPLVNQKLSLGMVQQMVFAGLYDAVNADLFTTPTLIMHGTKDGLVPAYFAQDWYNGISSQDKEIVYWEGQMHEVFNEPAKGEAMDKVIGWLNAHNV